MAETATQSIPQLLTERVRPKKFEQLILPQRIKDSLGNGDIKQNVLLYGSPGTGKTSAAKVLSIRSMGHADFYINCSDESGVDTIREKITKLCTSISVMDDGSGYSTKVIILDEIDGVSDQFFKALRGTVEKFTNCRFVATTNHINKIPEAISSRFECVNFDFVTKEEEREVMDEWGKRVPMILGKLGISATEDATRELITRNFPDMRRLLNKIQNLHISGVTVLSAEMVRQLNWSFVDLYKVIMSKPNPLENYRYVVGELSQRVDDVMKALGDEFVDWLEVNHPAKLSVLPHIIIEVAKHQAMRNQVIDPVTCLNSLVYSIQMHIHK